MRVVKCLRPRCSGLLSRQISTRRLIPSSHLHPLPVSPLSNPFSLSIRDPPECPNFSSEINKILVSAGTREVTAGLQARVELIMAPECVITQVRETTVSSRSRFGARRKLPPELLLQRFPTLVLITCQHTSPPPAGASQEILIPLYYNLEACMKRFHVM